jgi:hypothetical protein
MVILSGSLPISSEIVENTDTLKMNTTIRFDSPKTISPALAGDIYPCTLSVNPGDFYFNSHDCCTCEWYSPCEELGSARPFFASKKSLHAIGLLTYLNLNDTTLFSKIDTQRDSKSCSLPAFAGQGLPKTTLVNWSSPVIIKTALNKYVIVSFVPITSESYAMTPNGPGTGHPYTSAIILHWFLQTDGSTNFNGVTSIVNNQGRSDPANYSASDHSMQWKLFDILGRKVREPDILGAKGNGSNIRLLISENRNCLRKIMMLFQ